MRHTHKTKVRRCNQHCGKELVISSSSNTFSFSINHHELLTPSITRTCNQFSTGVSSLVFVTVVAVVFVIFAVYVVSTHIVDTANFVFDVAERHILFFFEVV